MLSLYKLPHARTRAVENKSPVLGLALFVGLVGLLVSIASFSVHPAIAASSTYLNFQARLLEDDGSVVADGNYNIEFKIFNASSSSGSSQGTCSGDSNCLWVETRTSGNVVRVVNGYMSVNLGSVSAFASTINWDQQHWLTMNIGGTGSPSWDGEMSPRIMLTALPYSFSSGEVATSSGANRGKLSFGSVTNNPVIVLPNESGTVCTTGSVCTGYQAAGSYFVNGGNSFSGAAILGTNDSNSLSFETAGNTQATIAVGGATTFRNSTDSSSAFQIQNAGGNNIFGVNSLTGVVTQPFLQASYVGGADASGGTNSGTGDDDFVKTFVSGNYLYATKAANATNCNTGGNKIGCELQIYDISVPSSPTFISGADASGSANSGTGSSEFRSVFVSGRYAYITQNGSGGTCSQTAGSAIGCEFKIFDISNPSTPTYVGGADASGSANSGSGNSLLGGVYVNGRYAYIAKLGDATTCSQTVGSAIGCELQVYDVGNPLVPAYIGGADSSGSTNSGTGATEMESIFASGRYVYLGKTGDTGTCSQTPGSAIGCELMVFDTTNPSAPTYIGGAESDGTANGGGANSGAFNSVFVSGRYLYAAKNSSASACSSTPGSALGCEFQIYSVSDPSVPTYVGGADASGTTNGGTTASQFNSVFVTGRYAYIGKIGNDTACSKTAGSAVGCELQVYDVATPSSPTYLGGVDATGTTNGGTGTGTATDSNVNFVYVAGRYAYMAKDNSDTTACSGTAGSALRCEVQVYDISGVEATSLLAHSLEAGTLQVESDATFNGQVSIAGGLNVSQGASIQGDLGVGGKALFRNRTDSTTAFQIQNATGTSLLNFDTTKSVLEQSSFGPTYLGGADLSGSTNSGTTTGDDFNSVFVSGRYKYVTQTGDTTACSQTAGSAIGCELQIYDVSNPAAPTYIGGADGAGGTNTGTNGTSNSFVTGSGRYVYVGKVGNATACNATVGNANGCEIQIFDVTNPGAPTFTGAIDISGSATGTGNDTINEMYVAGRYLYVAKANEAAACSQTAGSAIGCELQIYDVSNPAAPTYIGGADVSGSTNSGTGDETAMGITVSGRYIYLGKEGHSTAACSITPGSAIGCELQIYDAANPSSPTYIGGADASGSTNSGSGNVNFTAVSVQGRYAYVAKNSSGGGCSATPGSALGCELQAYNVATPSTPTYVGGADASGSTNSGTGGNTATAVVATGSYVYLGKNGNATACSQTAGSAIGCELQMYDTSNPAAPTYVGGADVSGSTNTGTADVDFLGLVISGRYAYVAHEGDATACSQSAGSAQGCEGQVFDVSGIEAVSVLAHSLDAGSLQVQNNASIAGNLSVSGALNVGQNANIQGDLSVNGKITVTTSSATTAGSTVLSVSNSSGIGLLDVKQMGTNFGGYAESGAFIDRNAYIGEEFSRARTAVAGDTASADGGGTFGDFLAWQVDEQTATTNDCQAIIAADTVNGIAQLQNDDASTTCNMYHAAALGDLQLQFDADNLPVILMKVRPSHVGANDDLWVGLQDQTQLTANAAPDNGIFFTNNDGTTWTGVTRSASTSSTVACTGQTVNTGATQYALLKIEVVSTTDVRFYVDSDVSNGISWVYCGQSTTNIPTSALSSMLKWSSTTTTRQLNTDFFRVWQDDSQPQTEEQPTDGQTEQGSQNQEEPEGLQNSDSTDSTPPLEVVTPTNEASNAFIDFTAATSQDMVYNHNVYVYGTLFADRIIANQIEGLEVFTDKLTQLQQQLEDVSSNGEGQTNPEPGQVAGYSSAGLDIAALNLSLSEGLLVAGEAQFYGNSFFHKLVTFVEKVVFKNDVSFEGHILTDGVKPDIYLEDAAGVVSSEDGSATHLAEASVEGNDSSGQIELGFGDGASEGQLLKLGFNHPYAKAPRVFITPANAAAAKLRYFVLPSSDGFKIVSTEPPVPGSSAIFYYWTVQ